MTSVRILHIIVGLEAGGAELMMSRLIDRNHGRAELEHRVISLTDIGPIGKELQLFGVTVYALGIRGVRGLPLGFWRLVRTIREERPDVVQTWMYHADFLGGLAAFVNRRRIVWGVRATDVKSEGVRKTVWLRRLCAVLSHWLPDKIICAAEASRRAHIDIGYDPSRMIVIPNGFDVPTLADTATNRASARARFGIAANELVVGTVGRFNPVKDYATFVEAAALIVRVLPQARFLMVGRGLDVDNPELMRWIRRAGITERTILLGERTDVLRCLAVMDVFCLSSRNEGFPNVVGEAMSAGLSCVVTDVGDAALLVGETGIVVPCANPSRLASGVLSLLHLAPQQRLDWGIAARRRIESHFTIEAVRIEYADIYRALSSDARRLD